MREKNILTEPLCQDLREEGLKYRLEFSQTDGKLSADCMTVFLTAREELSEFVLEWDFAPEEVDKVLGDHWERAYGDLEWTKAGDKKGMPWYFAALTGTGAVRCYGVKVLPGAMCWWEIREKTLLLHMDVRCGGKGVILSGRELEVCSVLMREYQSEEAMESGKTAFLALRQFCSAMSPVSLLPKDTIYGSNNWYYAYGCSSKEEILEDSAYLARMTEGLSNRPFMVIDDGWQIAHKGSYNGGPWDRGNADYGDMKELAAGMKAYGVRPGIWFRPLWDTETDFPAEWRLEREDTVLDPSVPEVLEKVKEDIRRISSWGYDLIKHDFSTFDLLGNWGFQMGMTLTENGWSFKDRSRTTAEIIRDFYQAIREAAGPVMILGCNCVGHLGAGLMEANRTGDDTSGREWDRTVKMGVNTLAFRTVQQGSFFGADADCVGITEAISWERNRQWMQVLSESGTPFFASVKPGLLTKEQEAELKEAYRKASYHKECGYFKDWLESKTPCSWESSFGTKTFDWNKDL